jgi:drug/metabolite transporter (DMT)-like permease
MTSAAIALVLCSTFMHAGWNLLARGQPSPPRFFLRMLGFTALVGFLPAAVSEAAAASLPPKAWACVLGSGLCCGVYYLFLGRAYQSLDFTVAYPVTRALPVLLVGLGDLLRGREVTPLGWLALLLVALGCSLVPLRSLRDLALRSYLHRTTAWMLLAAAGTAGYTLLDKVASEVVRQGPASAARYGYFFCLTSWAAYALFLRLFGPGKPDPGPARWRIPALGAILQFGAYWLVLWAYQLTPQASYILAFRQFSIVLGVAAGLYLYREKPLPVRLLGTSLLTCGLLLIAFL